MDESYKRNPNTNCIVCSGSIYRRPAEIRRGRVFCSQACYGIANRKEKPCIVCGTPIQAHLNKRTCSRACANKNRIGIRYKIGSPRDKVKDERALKLRLMASRGTICERCDYNKKEILNVHHKDRNHGNNNMENLELLCPNCHAEEHHLKNSWMAGALSD